MNVNVIPDYNSLSCLSQVEVEVILPEIESSLFRDVKYCSLECLPHYHYRYAFHLRWKNKKQTTSCIRFKNNKTSM